MGMGCNRNRGGFFEGYEAFWIIVVIAIVIIWVHCMNSNDCCCNDGGNCGCGNFDHGCNNNNCCNSCC